MHFWLCPKSLEIESLTIGWKDRKNAKGENFFHMIWIQTCIYLVCLMSQFIFLYLCELKVMMILVFLNNWNWDNYFQFWWFLRDTIFIIKFFILGCDCFITEQEISFTTRKCALLQIIMSLSSCFHSAFQCKG